MARATDKHAWASLPADVLGSVLQLCGPGLRGLTLTKLRSVCKSWAEQLLDFVESVRVREGLGIEQVRWLSTKLPSLKSVRLGSWVPRGRDRRLLVSLKQRLHHLDLSSSPDTANSALGLARQLGQLRRLTLSSTFPDTLTDLSSLSCLQHLTRLDLASSELVVSHTSRPKLKLPAQARTCKVNEKWGLCHATASACLTFAFAGSARACTSGCHSTQPQLLEPR